MDELVKIPITLPVVAVLAAWVPLVLLLFAVLPTRRAVLASVIGGWLFLPMAEFQVAGFPEYSKPLAVNLVVFLAAAVTDQFRVLRFRPRLADVPMVAWCLCPMLSSLANGLGAYDGVSSVFTRVVAWGLPYVLARVYLSDWVGVRELAIAIFIGGLVYVPLCLLEIRMSPQLHNWVYGYHQHEFAQTRRLGGYRPMVFLQHGLAVGMWMTAAALTGWWLWYEGKLRRWRGVPAMYLLGPLLATTALCRSVGALALLGMGAVALHLSHLTGTRVWVLVLLSLAPAYAAFRVPGYWEGQGLVELATIVNRDRADSLAYRIRNENLLIDKAMRQPVFGWGGWNRSRVFNKEGNDISVTDGLWIIALGNNGLVGLGALVGSLSVPLWLVSRRYQPRDWGSAALAPAVVLGVVCVLFLLDSLMNAMPNPGFIMAAGSVTGAASGPVASASGGARPRRRQLVTS